MVEAWLLGRYSYPIILGEYDKEGNAAGAWRESIQINISRDQGTDQGRVSDRVQPRDQVLPHHWPGETRFRFRIDRYARRPPFIPFTPVFLSPTLSQRTPLRTHVHQVLQRSGRRAQLSPE